MNVFIFILKTNDRWPSKYIYDLFGTQITDSFAVFTEYTWSVGNAILIDFICYAATFSLKLSNCKIYSTVENILSMQITCIHHMLNFDQDQYI